MSLCSTASLNAWDKIQELRKRTESNTKVIQGPREPFSDFLQRLTKVVERGVADPEVRQVFIESLAFENGNLECKETLGPLKIRSIPVDKWILHTANVESFDYNTEAWVGEVISKCMKDIKIPNASIVVE